MLHLKGDICMSLFVSHAFMYTFYVMVAEGHGSSMEIQRPSLIYETWAIYLPWSVSSLVI